MVKTLSVDTLDNVKFRVYTGLVGTLYVCYFLVFFGIYYVNPNYIKFLSICIQLFICLFLLWVFNPFVKPKLRAYDGQIIFAAAFFLLNNVVATEIFAYFQKSIQTITSTVNMDTK